MIRRVTERQEIEETRQLASYAFNANHTDTQKEEFLIKGQFIDNYVEEINGKVTSQVINHPYEVMINGQVMTSAGIVDVASYPERRGTGSITRLFEYAFKDLYERGTELSYLAPFSQPFYRKFGYEMIFDIEETYIPTHVIQQVKQEKKGYMKRVFWEDEEAQKIIKALYRKTLGSQNGSLLREDYWWDFEFKYFEGKRLAIAYDDNDVPCGYINYSLIGFSEFKINELAYTNMFALRKLMTFVSSHSGSFPMFVAKNIDVKMVSELFTETIEVRRKKQTDMMARILDFERFIGKFKFRDVSTKYSLYLEVNDANCPWNDGMFKVEIENGQANCQKVEEGKADYSGTIQRWTQVFLGKHTVEEAIWAEFLEFNGENEVLSDLIEPNTPHLYDHF